MASQSPWPRPLSGPYVLPPVPCQDSVPGSSLDALCSAVCAVIRDSLCCHRRGGRTWGTASNQITDTQARHGLSLLSRRPGCLFREPVVSWLGVPSGSDPRAARAPVPPPSPQDGNRPRAEAPCRALEGASVSFAGQRLEPCFILLNVAPVFRSFVITSLSG